MLLILSPPYRLEIETPGNRKQHKCKMGQSQQRNLVLGATLKKLKIPIPFVDRY